VGNPLRFERSVSLGVISALDRFLPGGQGAALEGLVQTDAAINPGNSGGPLINARGRVVGISTAIIPYAQGIGFAIPSTTAHWVAGVLIKRGSIDRPYVGIAARSEQLSNSLVQLTGQQRGVRVITVGDGTPAALAGLKDGDLLCACNNEPVQSVDDLQRVMVLSGAVEVRIAFLRGGKRVEGPLRPKRQTA
jgi:S1-C subfamily serine protease